MTDDKVMRPLSIPILEYQKWIDKKLRIRVENGVEPVICGVPLDSEVFACEHKCDAL